MAPFTSVSQGSGRVVTRGGRQKVAGKWLADLSRRTHDIETRSRTCLVCGTALQGVLGSLFSLLGIRPGAGRSLRIRWSSCQHLKPENRRGRSFGQVESISIHQFRSGPHSFIAIKVFNCVRLLRTEAVQPHGERFVLGFWSAEGLHDAFIQIGTVELPRDPRVLVDGTPVPCHGNHEERPYVCA